MTTKDQECGGGGEEAAVQKKIMSETIVIAIAIAILFVIGEIDIMIGSCDQRDRRIAEA